MVAHHHPGIGLVDKTSRLPRECSVFSAVCLGPWQNGRHFPDDPDSKVHGAYLGPTRVLSAPDGPHVGLMNLAIRGHFQINFLEWKCMIFINISLKSVSDGPINNIPASVQIMAWCRPGDKQLSEPMMARLPTHMCVTRPQSINVEKLSFRQIHIMK